MANQHLHAAPPEVSYERRPRRQRMPVTRGVLHGLATYVKASVVLVTLFVLAAIVAAALLIGALPALGDKASTWLDELDGSTTTTLP